MTNAAIVDHILKVIASFETKTAYAHEIANSIDLLEPALENLSRVERDALHDLSVQIIDQDVAETVGASPNSDALNKLKELLKTFA